MPKLAEIIGRLAGLAAGSAVALAACGCAAPRGPRVVTDPDPGVKIPAIKQAVRRNELSAAPQLVKDLESDDPAVRFYAIAALERLTGERFGYNYYLDDDRRAPAVKQWQQWLGEQVGGTGRTRK